jgi:electron transfer flavoprotein alpha subunit
MSSGNFLEVMKRAGIIVFVDLSAGELDDYDKGMLSEAGRLAKVLDTHWSVAAFGVADAEPSADVVQEMAAYGVEKLTLMDGPETLKNSIEIQGQLLAETARETGAAVVLLPHNDLGAALAPLTAAELDSALFCEVIAYKAGTQSLILTRHVLGVQMAGSRTWDGQESLVLTVNPRILSSVVLPTMQSENVAVERHRRTSIKTAMSSIIERIPADPKTVDVSEAEVIVSAGLGCNAQAFEQVSELTGLLNASLGVTRPVYDLGYAGFERMVGQTGKTVAPRFYLALGISGSMHHLGGIKDSKRIVAVNIDSKAPIVANSDEAFVADLREVLPLLITKVKAATGGAQ